MTYTSLRYKTYRWNIPWLIPTLEERDLLPSLKNQRVLSLFQPLLLPLRHPELYTREGHGRSRESLEVTLRHVCCLTKSYTIWPLYLKLDLNWSRSSPVRSMFYWLVLYGSWVSSVQERKLFNPRTMLLGQQDCDVDQFSNVLTVFRGDEKQ